MSRGLSWRQRSMLRQLLRLEKARTPEASKIPRPVAWQELDYGPTQHETGEYDSEHDTPRVQWNIEQAQRRALRSLERRGLVDLGQYAFMPFAEVDESYHIPSPVIEWLAIPFDQHIPGRSRYMTGVLLTEAGRAIAETARRTPKRSASP